MIADRYAAVPSELKAISQWVGFRLDPPRKKDGKPTKVPIDPRTGKKAKTNDRATWGRFDQVVLLAQGRGLDGVGFVFTPEDEFFGVDIDKCRNAATGEIEAWALALIERLATYTEVSPSGTGVHCICLGTLPPGGRRKGKIEMYDSLRYFTVTGQRVEGAPPTIEDRSKEIAEIHSEVFGEASSNGQAREPQRTNGSHDDEWVIRRASSAQNGAKFRALMSGDISGYNSDSEAASALCFILAFWTRRNAAQMDRLFRRSSLMREKWDERRGDTTWGKREIANAIAKTTDVASIAFAPSTSAVDGDVTSKPSVLVPGAHHGPDGYVEINNMEFATDALDQLPPRSVFQRGRIPGEIIGPPGDRKFSSITVDRMRLRCDNSARFVRWAKKRGADEAVCTFVPCTTDQGKLILGQAVDHVNVRELISIARCPVYAGRAMELLGPGFNERHGIYYDQHPSTAGVAPIRDKSQIDTILADLLVDFPFQAEADRQNVIGLLLTPIVRPHIIGNIPLHLVLSCMERSGKTMLVEQVLGRVLLGAPTPAMSITEREEERDKRITALMLAGASLVHFDNLGLFVDSPVLSSLLTASTYLGRVLGLSQMVSLKNDLIVVGSGNNVRASSELAKRVVPIRLLPATDRPEERADFRHPDLPDYVESARPRILGALLGMVENWKESGRVPGTIGLGGFERFAAVVGGILAEQGYTQWLTNRREWLADADIQGGDLEKLVDAWREVGTEWVKPGVLFDLACQNDLYTDIVSDNNQNRARAILGRKVLLPARNRPVAGMRIEVRGYGSSRAYRLTPLRGQS